jgi:hypothetical protein
MDPTVVNIAYQSGAESARRHLGAEIERLRAALEELLWYVGQLEPLVYSADDTDEHEAVAKARDALK